jgi:hypothetical protein
MSNLAFERSCGAVLLTVVQNVLLLYVRYNQARTVLNARTRNTVSRALQA